jgi:hypothetical protein
MKNYFRTILRSLIGILFFSAFSMTLFAQANFAGNWGLNESKSKFGENQFMRGASSMVVTQDAKLLTVESTMQGRDGNEMKMSSKYNLDGSVSENPGFGDNTSKSVATWSADKKALTIVTTMKFERNGETIERKTTAEWVLAEGGKMLMVNTTRTNREGAEVKTTAAYDKK